MCSLRQARLKRLHKLRIEVDRKPLKLPRQRAKA